MADNVAELDTDILGVGRPLGHAPKWWPQESLLFRRWDNIEHEVVRGEIEKRVVVVGLGVEWWLPSKRMLDFFSQTSQSNLHKNLMIVLVNQEEDRDKCLQEGLIVGPPALLMYYKRQSVKFVPSEEIDNRSSMRSKLVGPFSMSRLIALLNKVNNLKDEWDANGVLEFIVSESGLAPKNEVPIPDSESVKHPETTKNE